MSQRDVKVGICGPAVSGKTAFITRIVSNEFDENSSTTIAFNVVFWETTVNGEPIKIIFADTPGTQSYLELGAKYFRGLDVIIFVFDSLREETIDQLNSYIEFAYENNLSASRYVIGSKFDLIQNEEQKVEQIENHAKRLVQQYSDSFQIEYLSLVSSKTNYKVKEVIDVVLHGALESAKQRISENLQLNPRHNHRPKSGCC